MNDPNDSTGTLPSKFLKFCVKVRNNDPSILPAPGQPFRIRRLSEKGHVKLADALLENTSVVYLALETENYTKSSAEVMAKYLRTSKRLQHIRWDGELRNRREIICCFLSAIQESTSLKEVDINFPLIGGPSNLALENMLMHTQSLRSLSLRVPSRPFIDVTAGWSGF
jgi:hypothetical protein